MRSGELAARAGVNPQTLRYYERIGLLPDPPRTASGYRDYPDDAVTMLRFVRRAKQLGFQLDEIHELLGFADRGDPCDSVRGIAEGRIDDLDHRIADLGGMRDALAELVARCRDDAAHDHACAVLASIGTTDDATT